MKPLNSIFRWSVPAAAVLAGLFAAAVISRGDPAERPEASPRPDGGALKSRVAGSGVIEPASRLIELSPKRSGVVAEVRVAPGDTVRQGEILVLIDDADAEASLRQREAEQAAARAKRIAAGILEEEAAHELSMYQSITEEDAVVPQELERRTFLARRRAAEHRAARADERAAEAAVKVAEAELEGYAIRAPMPGVALQVNARPGEYISVGGIEGAPVVFGSPGALHVRVDIDEADISRLDLDGAGMITTRGERRSAWDVRPVRIEPLVGPKRSLSNRSDERVDTRVLQVIYALPEGTAGLYPGQQVDAVLPARGTPR